MNEVCYEKVLDQAGKNQTLVFVHSCKGTAKTAKFIRDMVIEKETITQFVRPDSATREILNEESDNGRKLEGSAAVWFCHSPCWHDQGGSWTS
jgi:pre-mRNA-splicing helicase BRR2